MEISGWCDWGWVSSDGYRIVMSGFGYQPLLSLPPFHFDVVRFQEGRFGQNQKKSVRGSSKTLLIFKGVQSHSNPYEHLLLLLLCLNLLT
jgi:hypothetical protein